LILAALLDCAFLEEDLEEDFGDVFGDVFGVFLLEPSSLMGVTFFVLDDILDCSFKNFSRVFLARISPNGTIALATLVVKLPPDLFCAFLGGIIYDSL
jgi:hypothetical protein